MNRTIKLKKVKYLYLLKNKGIKKLGGNKMDIHLRVEEYAKSLYNDKDIMHDFGHINRIINMSLAIVKKHYPLADLELIKLGAYFHGVIYKENIRLEVEKFLRELNLSDEKIEQIIEIACSSQKENIPTTLEGKILHDAHLLEGGETFLIVKSLITGSLRGQTLLETIEYLEEKILFKHHCVLPEMKDKYREKELFAQDFIQKLKPNL